MPAMFLHSVFAYAVKRWNPSFSLPALLVGGLIPHVEILIIYYLTGGTIDRLLFHSVIGAITIGTLFSAGIVVFIYPSFVSFFFRIDKNIIQKNCAFSGTLLGLCLLGNLSHVLIDATHHQFNPLLYPIFTESIDLLRISSSKMFYTEVVTVVLSVIFLVFVVVFLRNGKGFWKQMLVG